MRAKAAAPASNLRTRIIAAAVLLPLVLLAFIFGPDWFVGLFLLFCLTLSVAEMAMMLIPAFAQKLTGLGVGLGSVTPMRRYMFPVITVGLGWLMMIATVFGTAEASVGCVALAAMVALLIGVFSVHDIDAAASRAFGILISLIYGALPWLVVWHLFKMAPHARYLLLVMCVTWSGDTGAYFAGRHFGGKVFGDRKLAPAISPKKTWEGAIGGLLMSVIGTLILNLIFLNELGSPASSLVWPLSVASPRSSGIWSSRHLSAFPG